MILGCEMRAKVVLSNKRKLHYCIYVFTDCQNIKKCIRELHNCSILFNFAIVHYLLVYWRSTIPSLFSLKIYKSRNPICKVECCLSMINHAISFKPGWCSLFLAHFRSRSHSYVYRQQYNTIRQRTLSSSTIIFVS